LILSKSNGLSPGLCLDRSQDRTWSFSIPSVNSTENRVEEACTNAESFKKDSDLTISPSEFRVRYNPSAISTLTQTICKRTDVVDGVDEFIRIKISHPKTRCEPVPDFQYPSLETTLHGQP
jgi:hypothetical protein